MTDANIDSRGLSWIGSMKMRGAGLEPAFLAERDFKSAQASAVPPLTSRAVDESAEDRRGLAGIDATGWHPARHPRALVACETSALVRDALRMHGINAWSCDVLPTEGDPRWHIQGDVRDVIGDGWDLMIAHPPCTDLAVSGARWFKGKQQQQQEALAFVRTLLTAPIERIAIENPVSIISTHIRKPDQIVQPWQFGDPESKTTCLWLKGLPPLVATNVLALPAGGRWRNQTPSGQNKLGPSPDRARIRSRTYAGIADAIACQWGRLLHA